MPSGPRILPGEDLRLATGTVIAVTRLLHNPPGPLVIPYAINATSRAASKWKAGCVFVINNSVFSGLGYSMDIIDTVPTLYKNSFRTSDTLNEGATTAVATANNRVSGAATTILGQTTLNQWDMYEMSLSSDKKITLYEGGAKITQNPVQSSPPGDYAITRLVINPGVTMDPQDLTTNSDCEIAEVLVFNRVLTDAERKMIEGYLAWKWGINDYLPILHPYRDGYP